MARKVILPRLPMSLRNKLDALVEVEGKSLSAVFRDAVEAGVSHHESDDNVPEKFDRLCVRVDHETYSKVRKIAKQRFTSINGIMAMFVKEYVEDNNALLRSEKENGNEQSD